MRRRIDLIVVACAACVAFAVTPALAPAAGNGIGKGHKGPHTEQPPYSAISVSLTH